MAEKKNAPSVVITEARVAALIAEAIKGIITEERVKVLVAEGYEGTVNLIAEAIRVIPNEDRIHNLIAEAGKELVTKEDVRVLIIDETAGIRLGLSDAFKIFVGEDRIKELIAEFTPPSLPMTLSTVSPEDAEEVDLFDPTLLEGLEIDGRPMTTDDILSGVMNGDTITIVSRDGRKYTITRA